jgi:hypothetical protein
LFDTDDGLHIFEIAPRNLQAIIDLGHHKKRPDIKGAWVRDKEERLGHKIKPYKPVELEPERDPENLPKGFSKIA